MHISNATVAVRPAEPPAEPAFIDPVEIATAYDGVGFVVDMEGRVVVANAAAEPLIECLMALEEEGLRLRDTLASAIADPRPISKRVELGHREDSAAGPQVYDLNLLPCLEEDANGSRFVGILALGQEATFERNLTRALAASRELFRDLVACSADLAFETDCDGLFLYASAAGVAGYTAKDLNGRPSEDLLIRAEPGERDNPFTAQSPIYDVEQWVKGADGRDHCLLVNAKPAIDRMGRITGTRGIARDVTELRQKEMALALETQRRELIFSIVDAMRQEIRPQTILETAANHVANATGASHCLILGREVGEEAPSEHYEVCVRFADEGERDHLGPLCEALEQLLNNTLAEQPAGRLTIASRATVLVPCEHQGVLVGYLVVAFPTPLDAVPDDLDTLLADVAPHVGVTLAQAEHTQLLERISQTDPLTGLANRRALRLKLEQSVDACRRLGHEGALLYIDVDDFKPINDRLGHKAGDAFLEALGAMLRESSRRDDVAARLGGDEFCLWLQGSSARGAQIKADKILAAREAVSEAAGIPWAVSLSIGAAHVKPHGDESVDGLMDRADRALYTAKAQGKNQVIVSAAAPEVLPDTNDEGQPTSDPDKGGND